jgi:nucleotide-binding universal stress UspA family protein
VDAGTTPILIAYDGSELARAAVRHAGELFPGRPALVATVWEPGLASMTVGVPDDLGVGVPTPDPATIEAVDRAERDHASAIAAQGAELAAAAGLAAEPYAVPDELDVVRTLIEIANERDAAAVVVGSHGISGLRSRLLGRVSRKLIEHCDRPVLVIRAAGPD